MKKFILAGFFCLCFLAGCSSKEITVISAEEAVQRLDNKESMVLVLEEIMKNYEELPLVKIYIDDEDPIAVEGEEEQVRVHFRELQEKTVTMPSTPTTLFIKDGKLMDSIVGNKEYAKVVSKLQSTGFISQ